MKVNFQLTLFALYMSWPQKVHMVGRYREQLMLLLVAHTHNTEQYLRYHA